jgi:hypothetical protein
LAQLHAAGDVLGIQRGFDEHDLYANLTWLSAHREAMEKRLFAKRRGPQKPELFLCDVTSSYLEGADNASGAYGYNRDGKKGKEQIVIGLLCDEQGAPVSTEVFRGNTQDPKTFAAQVKKASARFGCERVAHDRYKDLTLVEQAFRTCKTAHLETRPVYVRTAEHTRGHVLVVMLAYLIRRELSHAWTVLDVTVEEGLHQLQTLCSIKGKVTEGGSCLRIPTPSPATAALLQALKIRWPEALPHTDVPAVTRKKLSKRRKPR